VVVANLAVGKPWAPIATPILTAYAPLLTALVGVLDMSAAQLHTAFLGGDLSAQARYAVDAGFIVTGVAAAGFIFTPIRRDVANFIPIEANNPVHALALSLALVFFGTQVTFIAFTDVLASDRAQPPLSILDLFLNETPFLILGLAGVGLFIRRQSAEAARRLGFVIPAWWHIALALAAAGVFFALANGSDALNHRWEPGVASEVDATTQHLFGQLGGPVGIAAIALIPGICEELLFRGALQPRLGIVATALLFTSIHTQYGMSVDTLAIFAIAIGLGLIRKYTNTTTSCTCHVSYNLLAGFGIAGAPLVTVILLEIVLAGAAAWGIWSSRRRPAAAANPS
jgi:membrane protease YdiL (CAAX protease family)